VRLFGAGDTDIWIRQAQTSPFHMVANEENTVEGFRGNLINPSDCNFVKIVDCDGATVKDCTGSGGRIFIALIGSRHCTVQDVTAHDMLGDINTDEKGFSDVLIQFTGSDAAFKDYTRGWGNRFIRCAITNTTGDTQYGMNLGGWVDLLTGQTHYVDDTYVEDLVVSGVDIYGLYAIYARRPVFTVSKQEQGSITGCGHNGMLFDQCIQPHISGYTVSENQRAGFDIVGTAWGDAGWMRSGVFYRPGIEHCTVNNNGRSADNTYPGIHARQGGRPVPTTDLRVESCNVLQTLSGNRQSSGITAVEGEALRTRRVGGRYGGLMPVRYSLGTTGIDIPVHIDEPPLSAVIGSRY
jgi:hypothetical protein